MAKLKIFSGKELCKLLSLYGFAEVRKRGSHIIMQKQGKETTITIPVPEHKEIALGTLQSIIRQSELPRELFETK